MSISGKQSSIIFLSIVFSITTTLISGCTIMKPAKQESMTTYALDVQFEAVQPETGTATLLVSTPTAQSGFGSSHMIYVKKPLVIDYFSLNKWVDSPARMLTPLLTQVLERSEKYRAVVQTRSAAMADIRLDTDIIRMQHEFLSSPSRVRLTIRAQLVDIRGKKILATREFDVTETAPTDDPHGGAIATNRAVKILLLQISDFCAKEIKANEARTAEKQ